MDQRTTSVLERPGCFGVGVFEGDELVSMAVAMPAREDNGRSPRPVPGLLHISSVATGPEFRRNGYGAALTAWVTRAFLAEGRSPATLGMYAWNDTARRMYRRLGYVGEHTFSAGSLNRVLDAHAPAGA